MTPKIMHDLHGVRARQNARLASLCSTWNFKGMPRHKARRRPQFAEGAFKRGSSRMLYPELYGHFVGSIEALKVGGSIGLYAHSRKTLDGAARSCGYKIRVRKLHGFEGVESYYRVTRIA
jgi:hypothetical protein